ncbi:putative cytochrome P450 [Ixodes scapularis]
MTSELATSFAIAVAVLTSWLVLRWLRRDKGTHGPKPPPGPRGIPLLGNLGLSGHVGLYRKCMHWADEYGPIFSIRMGAAKIVVLNDFPSMKKFYSMEESVYRPEKTIFHHNRDAKGLASLGGEAWKQNRRSSLSVLRDLGFGKASMEEHIKEELRYLIQHISTASGTAIPVQEFLLPSTSNVISALLFGTTYAFDDPRRKRDRVQEHNLTLQKDINRDFIDGYLKKIKEHHNESNSPFQEKHLLGNAVDFYIAGTSTSASFIHWLLAVCAQKPDTVQSRIQREIDDHVGRGRQPAWEDSKKMHFTMASVFEILRWKNPLPVTNARGTQEDTILNGYIIPKGTMVISNIMAVHRDPTLWERPDDFDPTRFLSADGSCPAKRPEEIMTFSVGKRMCPADKLATVEIFLYVASLLQKFTVFPEEGKRLPCLDSLDVMKTHPAVRNMRFVSR